MAGDFAAIEGVDGQWVIYDFELTQRPWTLPRMESSRTTDCVYVERFQSKCRLRPAFARATPPQIWHNFVDERRHEPRPFEPIP
jgi:hypothetical protein